MAIVVEPASVMKRTPPYSFSDVCVKPNFAKINMNDPKFQ